jgi:dTDP-4-amino-4,6-dideoxygalactose transaminase
MASTASIVLSDPDISTLELEAVSAALQSPRLSQGPRVAQFEREFAHYVGRSYGVAVASGTLALWLVLQAKAIGAGAEVIVSPYSWHHIGHAVSLCGATPVFADIDYWSGTLDPAKAAAKLSARTRAIVVGNTNGHPAAWEAFHALRAQHGVLLIEDSSEAIGSRYQGSLVGSFGDCAVFDFSQPAALICGEGAMVVTDDEALARALRAARCARLEHRHGSGVGAGATLQAGMSDLAAALALVQLQRVDRILERRKQVASYYFQHMKSFEGIKDPYVAPGVDEVNWFLYVVHLGTRFSRSSRNAIVEDLRNTGVEATAYCQPLHLQPAYAAQGPRKGECFVTEKLADRAVALPFHGHLREEDVDLIVQTAKDASINVGAGSAIYL